MLTTSVLISGLRAAEPDPALLDAVHASGTQIDTAGMAVLGGWAVVNIAGGVAGSLTADDPRQQAFHQGNAAWNVVNLAIAGGGLASARRRSAAHPQWPELPVDLAKQRGVLLFNLGLDVAYTSSGALLWTQRDDPRLQGLGQALTLQGTFLAAFDLSMILLSARSAAQLKPYLSQDTLGVALTF